MNTKEGAYKIKIPENENVFLSKWDEEEDYIEPILIYGWQD